MKNPASYAFIGLVAATILGGGALMVFNPSACTYVAPGKDTAASAWTMKGGPVPPDADVVLLTVREALPCAVLNATWSGTVTWVDGPLDCQGVKAAGCWDGIIVLGGAAYFRISSGALVGPSAADGALIHETGHYGWNLCGKDTQPDFKGCASRGVKVEDCPHPADFLAWVEATRTKARAALAARAPALPHER